MLTYATITKERAAYVEGTFLGAIERVHTAHSRCIAVRNAGSCTRVQAIVWRESTFSFLSSIVSILPLHRRSCTDRIAAAPIHTRHTRTALHNRVSYLKRGNLRGCFPENNANNGIILGLGGVCTHLAHHVLQSDFENRKWRGDIKVLVQDGLVHALRNINHERWEEQVGVAAGGDDEDDDECSN